MFSFLTITDKAKQAMAVLRFIYSHINVLNADVICKFNIYFAIILTNQLIWCIISMENAENICNNDR